MIVFLNDILYQSMEDYPSLAEGNGLENRQACKSVRGFEPHILLRQPMYIGYLIHHLPI